ncbi:MAG TPA: flagellar basal body rod protein FlgB [Firmicutes bacterium]|nr:flagellar basal body rod protein FlgB [Bacillota bacterium]
MSGLFGSPTFLAIQRALDALSLRHRVIANNIANVNTPGYKAMEVSFESELKSALEQVSKEGAHGFPGVGTVELWLTHPGHIPSVPASVSDVEASLVRENTVYRVDGNSVDIDREMARLAENTIRYNSLAQIAQARLRMLRSVVNEGRK